MHDRRIQACPPTHGTTRGDLPACLSRRLLRLLAACSLLLALAVAAPTAGAIVGGTDQKSDAFAAPLAFLTITDSSGTGWCTGTLISPTVVMTAAHCVYETSRRGNLLGVSTPSEIAVRVGSRNVSNAELGTRAGVVAVLPQPYYRWDGSRHNHDVALLALDRAMSQTPAALAEQHPDAGKPLLIAGYGSTSTNDNTDPGSLKEALIDAADPASCTLVSESFDPSWLFCGSASTDPALPGGTSCYGDSGGPAFASENTSDNLVVEGIISYGSRHACEFSRSYLVLVSSERGFIDRALATAAQNWKQLRDLPPTVVVKPVHRRLNQRGALTLRVDDDKSRRSRVGIVFYTHAGKRLSRAFRSVPTNRWVQFSLGSYAKPFSGYVCAQGSDATKKQSNIACAANVIK
jgi:secreted trypsin-like serine protease